MASFKNVKIGIDIFVKHLGEDESIGGADHDVLYGASSDFKPTKEEAEQLEKAGWRLTRDGWEIFV